MDSCLRRNDKIRYMCSIVRDCRPASLMNYQASSKDYARTGAGTGERFKYPEITSGLRRR